MYLFGHNRHGSKIGGGLCPLFWGQELGPRLTQSRLGRGLAPCQVASNPFSRLATIDMGRKLGCCDPYLGDLGPHLTKLPGSRPTSVPNGILIHPAVWPQRTLAENWGLCEAYLRTNWYTDGSSCLATIDMGRKCRAVPLFGEARFPSNTMSPGPRSTSLLSGILIHLPAWPQ